MQTTVQFVLVMLQYYRSYLRPTRPSGKSQTITLKARGGKNNVHSSVIHFEVRGAAPKKFKEKDQSDLLQGEQNEALQAPFQQCLQHLEY